MTDSSVFTVGNKTNYDRGIRDLGDRFIKKGRTLHANGSINYSGGFAFRTPDDARRLIREWDMEEAWAVYELDANWSRDTIPSENGWWHALINDAQILRRIDP